ncbi:MAG TPA: hypothetical protein VFS23_16445, partial [Vicinamibacterales bacterium]|nr:hypothetical protein [Vicinamibacterales bacterium]
MIIRLGQVSGGHRRDVHLRRLAGTSLLLLVCSVAAACGVRTGTFELAPTTPPDRAVQPLRVGVIIDKTFVPYKIKFRYWSTTPFSWSLEGLPDAFVQTLRPYFLSVDPVQESRSPSTGPHDLVARMVVDRLHFDGANTTIGSDTVDLTMTFTLGQPGGAEVFRTTVSASASSEYSQPCGFCKPDPPAAFQKAFNAVFAQLSERLR